MRSYLFSKNSISEEDGKEHMWHTVVVGGNSTSDCTISNQCQDDGAVSPKSHGTGQQPAVRATVTTRATH